MPALRKNERTVGKILQSVRHRNGHRTAAHRADRSRCHPLLPAQKGTHAPLLWKVRKTGLPPVRHKRAGRNPLSRVRKTRDPIQLVGISVRFAEKRLGHIREKPLHDLHCFSDRDVHVWHYAQLLNGSNSLRNPAVG